MGCGSSAGAVIEQNRAPGFKGPVFMTIKHALLERDVRFIGVMDPYIKLIMGKQEFKTPVAKEGGKHPKWEGCTHTFQKLLGEPDVIIGQVWCENTITSDILIGEGAFSLTSIRKGNAEPKRISFLLFHHGEKAGEISLEATFTLDPSGKDLPEIKAPDTEGKFIVKPKFGRLKKNANLLLKMDPFLTIHFGNETMNTSVDAAGHTTPKWNDEIIFTRETNEDTLYIEVWAESLIGWNDFLGCGYASITDSLALKENQLQTVTLFYDGANVGEVEIECTFKTAKPQDYLQKDKQSTEAPTKESFQQQLQTQYQQPQQQQPQQQQPQQQQVFPQQLNQFVQNYEARYQNSYGQQPMNGRVDFTYPNGDHYSGDMMNNLKHGQGRLQFSYGGYYEGQWANDQYNGMGVLVVGDSRYEGQFINGKKNGQGKQVWNNRQQYDGQWVDNNMHGNGEWTFVNGAKKKGVWAHGNRLRWLDDDQNIIQAGKTMTSGFMLTSPNQQFTLSFFHDGRLYIFHNQTRQPIFSAINFNRQPLAPVWLKFDPSGELQMIDAKGVPYWVSGQNFGIFAPPFVLILQDDGRLVIQDANGQAKWYSH
ncbi:unnamed protein product [Paramecium primaurelia]|uniref:C2 domain-containing protein n=1 Tax=Paramecium primaurelia TaxID=5886 RepID=A0A8S1N962_PARPR|nr:unnamed protein product [Paramecium primaurelia]